MSRSLLNINEESARLFVDHIISGVPSSLARILFSVFRGILSIAQIPPTLDHYLRKIHLPGMTAFQFVACYSPLPEDLLDRVRFCFSLRCPKLDCLSSDDLQRVVAGYFPLDSAFEYMVVEANVMKQASLILNDRDFTKDFECVEVYGGEVVCESPSFIKKLILSAAVSSDPNTIGRDLCNELHLAIVGSEIQGNSAITKGFRYVVTSDSASDDLLRALSKYYARDCNMSMTFEASQEWKRIIMEQLRMDKTDLKTIVHMNKIASYYRRMNIWPTVHTSIRMYYDILRLLSDKTFKEYLGDYCSFPIAHSDSFYLNCPVIVDKMSDVVRNYAVRHYTFTLIPVFGSFCHDHNLTVTCRVSLSETVFKGLLWRIGDDLIKFLTRKMMGERRFAIYESLSPHFPSDIVNRIMHMALLQSASDKSIPFSTSCPLLVSNTKPRNHHRYAIFICSKDPSDKIVIGPPNPDYEETPIYFNFTPKNEFFPDVSLSSHDRGQVYFNIPFPALSHYAYSESEKDWAFDGYQQMDVFISSDGHHWCPLKEEGQKSKRVYYVVRYPIGCDLNVCRYMPSTYPRDKCIVRRKLIMHCPWITVFEEGGLWHVKSLLHSQFSFSHVSRLSCLLIATSNVHYCGDMSSYIAAYLSTFVFSYEFVAVLANLPCSEWFVASIDGEPKYVVGNDVCIDTNPFTSAHINKRCTECTSSQVSSLSELYWDGKNYSTFYRDVSLLACSF